VEDVMLGYLTRVMQRPTVSRSTTLMWHFRMLQSVWPSVRRSARVAAWMRGLAIVDPLSPERAGRVLERQWNVAAVVQAGERLLEVPSRQNLLVIQALANMLAGARLTETVRDMALGLNGWTVLKGCGRNVILEVAQGRPKDDLVGVQPHLRPKMVQVPVSWLRAAPTRVVMRRGEEEMISRMVAAVVRGAGGVASVTAARRAVASSTWAMASGLGLADADAIGVVRDVLGHAPDSASTWRYLPARLGAQARMSLVDLARRRCGGVD